MAASKKDQRRAQVAMGNKDAGTKLVKDQAVATIAAIAVPGTATAEDCANKINEVIAALKVAGIIS